MFFKFIYRKDWSLDEDINVLYECRENQYKWGDVARKIIGRNQHQIKNRFIYLMAKGLDCKNDDIRKMITRKSLDSAVLVVLEGLRRVISTEGNLVMSKHESSFQDCLI